MSFLRLLTRNSDHPQKESLEKGEVTRCKSGAGDETRTRDIFLGKEVLYQLSYTRVLSNRGWNDASEAMRIKNYLSMGAGNGRPTPRSRIRQKNCEGAPSGASTGGHPQLRVKICGMLLHGIRGGAQDGGDFRVRLAFGDPVKHFRFAGRQSQGQECFGTLIHRSVFNSHER
jgi:hypothetical protein